MNKLRQLFVSYLKKILDRIENDEGTKIKRRNNKMSAKRIYIIEHGSFYDDEPWQIIGYCETEEEAQNFINKQLFSRLYHYILVNHL